MRPQLTARIWFIWFPTLLCLLAWGVPAVQAGEVKIEALLVWGTDDAKSPNPKHKPVPSDIRQKLKSLPLKWKNYFEENRKTLTVAQGASARASLSERCEIEVRNLGDSKIGITHYGKGEKVVEQTQALPKGEIFVLGGNAPNETAWLVILKRVE